MMNAASTESTQPFKPPYRDQRQRKLTDEQIRLIADQVYLRLLAEMEQEYERFPIGTKHRQGR